MTGDHRALEARIGRLEKRNRLLGAAVLGLLVLGVAAAADRPATSRAGAFQLIDASGAVRAELALRDDGVGLFLKDEAGVDRLLAVHDAGGTGLYLDDETGTNRIGVAQFAHGGGGVALHGPESKGAAVLYLKGQGSLRFFDAEGTVTSQFPAADREERRLDE